MVRLLGKFVECESPSHEKAAVDRMGELVAAEWRQRGAKVQVLKQSERGNHVRAEAWMGEGKPAGKFWCWDISTRCIRPER